MDMAQTNEHVDKKVGRIMKKISVSKDDDNPGYWKITYRKKTGQTIVVDEQLLENIIILYRLGSNPTDKDMENGVSSKTLSHLNGNGIFNLFGENI